MVACCCFTIALPSSFTEPCQGDVIAAELSGQQGGGSGAKERRAIGVKGKMENMTKPAGAALCGQTACSGLARSGPKRFIGNPLGPPDVLDGSESPAIKTI
ncbi:hypothetical protein JOB18_047070 [Solea senegalensis]|uniref:Secreted protein n=1 Tax=Solea senegalensis TaxID=28829 RepID=A0AAV6Q602_SOLSE|nr:hypothetical protein JOB18_047070 [Solea senegalensis]